MAGRCWCLKLVPAKPVTENAGKRKPSVRSESPMRVIAFILVSAFRLGVIRLGGPIARQRCRGTMPPARQLQGRAGPGLHEPPGISLEVDGRGALAAGAGARGAVCLSLQRRRGGFLTPAYAARTQY